MDPRVVFLLAALFTITTSESRKTCSHLRGFSIFGFFAGRVVSATFDGSPIDLFDRFQNYGHPKMFLQTNDLNIGSKLFLGYDGDVFVVKYLSPRHTFLKSEVRLGVVDGPGMSTVRGITKFNHTSFDSSEKQNFDECFPRSNDSSLQVTFLTFFNNIFSYHRSEWYDVVEKIRDDDWKLPEDLNLGVSVSKTFVDPVSGKIYQEKAKNRDEKTLIGVIGGKKVYRKVCHPTEDRQTYDKIRHFCNISSSAIDPKNTGYFLDMEKDPAVCEVVLEHRNRMHCFEVDGCEIAHAPAAMFYDLLVVPKEPIQVALVNETVPMAQEVRTTEEVQENSTDVTTTRQALTETKPPFWDSMNASLQKASPFLSVVSLILISMVLLVMCVVACLCCCKSTPKKTLKKGKAPETDTEASTGTTTKVSKNTFKDVERTPGSPKKPKKAPSKMLVEIEKASDGPSRTGSTDAITADATQNVTSMENVHPTQVTSCEQANYENLVALFGHARGGSAEQE
ncbi:hypothetical protein L596_012425 [Steinernema carpocapsae]|uniref:ZP domain-containing protein n=1 Tax=Steinernema carpocapsae TaxID=34508 RepID=A0A4U5NX88_STECR|nr:hypothetical protein L596_012425 [Steinernema carpocapsae]